MIFIGICEFFKIGGKVIQIYAGVISREIFKILPFKKVIEKLFALRQKYKDEENNLLQNLAKLIMNSLIGSPIRKDDNEAYKCKSEQWMQLEYEDNVLDYWRLPKGHYILKFKKDEGLDGDNEVKNTLPSHLAAFISSKSKQIMNNFIKEINGFYNNSIYYGDTVSMYTKRKYWNVLDKVGSVGNILYQSKRDLKSSFIFYGLFLTPKIEFVLTIDGHGIIQQHLTFKGFNDSKRFFDRSQYFKMLNGKNLSVMLPRSW